MYVYILIQEEMNVKSAIESIRGASYIDASVTGIDISNDEHDCHGLAASQ